MSDKKFLTDKMIYILSGILLLTFILSFTKLNSNNNKTDKRKAIKTALINPKNIPSINKIKITKGQDKILTIFKIDNIWFLSDADVSDNNNHKIICDSNKINSFLEEFSAVRNIYKVSEKGYKDTTFGLNNESTIKIRYYLENSSFFDLTFGNQDFAQTSRYFMDSKGINVYEMNNSLDKYLSVLVQNWSEPYLFSKELNPQLSSSDIQKITISQKDNPFQKILTPQTDGFSDICTKYLDLRHGGNGFDIKNLENCDLKLEFELGNKNSAVQYIVQISENEYSIISKYSISNTGKTYWTQSKISAWTYNKIIEIML